MLEVIETVLDRSDGTPVVLMIDGIVDNIYNTGTRVVVIDIDSDDPAAALITNWHPKGSAQQTFEDYKNDAECIRKSKHIGMS